MPAACRRASPAPRDRPPTCAPCRTPLAGLASGSDGAADRGHDGAEIRQRIRAAGGHAPVPTSQQKRQQISVPPSLCRQRDLIGRCFNASTASSSSDASPRASTSPHATTSAPSPSPPSTRGHGLTPGPRPRPRRQATGGTAQPLRPSWRGRGVTDRRRVRARASFSGLSRKTRSALPRRRSRSVVPPLRAVTGRGATRGNHPCARAQGEFAAETPASPQVPRLGRRCRAGGR